MTDQPTSAENNNGSEEIESSLSILAAQKKDLTKDVRKAGINEKDEAFLDSFSDTMQSKDTSKEEAKVDDEEIDQKISKAKQIDAKIFKKIHPEEYKKEQEALAQKKKEEEEYKTAIKQRMSDLNTEVDGSISNFMQTAEDLKKKTEERKKALSEIKKKYKHIVKKHDHLQKKMLKKAENEALVQATE